MSLEVGRSVISELLVDVPGPPALPPHDCKVAAIALSIVSPHSHITSIFGAVRDVSFLYLFFIKEEKSFSGTYQYPSHFPLH